MAGENAIQFAQMPTSRDLAIFMPTTTVQTDKPIALPLLCACTRGNDCSFRAASESLCFHFVVAALTQKYVLLSSSAIISRTVWLHGDLNDNGDC